MVTIYNKFVLINLKFVTQMLCEDGAISISIWISQNVGCNHTPCRPTLHIHIHICIHMDITKCGVSPHSM